MSLFHAVSCAALFLQGLPPSPGHESLWILHTNAVSDLVLALSCGVISVILSWSIHSRKEYSRRRMDTPFLLLFSFVGLSSAIELVDSLMRHPLILVSGLLKVAMAAAALVAAVLMGRRLRRHCIVAMPRNLAGFDPIFWDDEQRARFLAEGFPDYAIFLLDTKGGVVSWNPGAERLYQYRPEEVIGQESARFYDADDVKAGIPGLGLGMARSRGVFQAEGWRLRKDGSRFYAHEVLTAVHDGRGTSLGVAVVSRDLSERRGLEQQLATYREELEQLVEERTRQLVESQRVLQLVYDVNQDPMILFGVAPDRKIRVLSCNRAGAAWLGSDPEASTGGLDLDLLPAAFRANMLARLEEVEATGHPVRCEWRPAGPEEASRVFDTQILPVHQGDAEIHGYLLTARDISERVRMEENLRETQKLESLGVLAGGIAHDFNNLLTAILGNTNLAERAAPQASPVRAYLETIERTVLRAADLARQLLAYAGRGRFAAQEVDLNRLVEEMLQLLTISLSKKAALRLDLSETMPWVLADGAQIQQVIMNLVINASEAIGDERSGLITLRTGQQCIDGNYIGHLAPLFPMQPGTYATLEVSDNGCGMSPETQGRIFEPFFTTKFSGRGLGLSAVIGILRNHKGGLKIYSEPGHGSTFKLFLPLAGSSGRKEPKVRGVDWRADGRWMLLVDDEAAVRLTTREMASRMGFQVIEASDGQEALGIFRERHHELSLVFMDLTMPRLDGRTAFREMRRVDPSVPTVLCSGYHETDSGATGDGQGIADFLQKPFRFEDFRATVARAAGAGRASEAPVHTGA